ncbi:hypothetical protein [Sneathiella chinensis]|uniref:Uncharacterized protein n=1 Tax=Sneathiella chinensis TaxID=349750 RepID=A0ABQ5U9I5_9PROT|nr:hypothetical protein [Sneathiella chinensis]GLQ07840.1 hypothetical protein GCM10007924_30620 [Sneathiella chinensis]
MYPVFTEGENGESQTRYLKPDFEVYRRNCEKGPDTESHVALEQGFAYVVQTFAEKGRKIKEVELERYRDDFINMADFFPREYHQYMMQAYILTMTGEDKAYRLGLIRQVLKNTKIKEGFAELILGLGFLHPADSSSFFTDSIVFELVSQMDRAEHMDDPEHEKCAVKKLVGEQFYTYLRIQQRAKKMRLDRRLPGFYSTSPIGQGRMLFRVLAGGYRLQQIDQCMQWGDTLDDLEKLSRIVAKSFRRKLEEFGNLEFKDVLGNWPSLVLPRIMGDLPLLKGDNKFKNHLSWLWSLSEKDFRNLLMFQARHHRKYLCRGWLKGELAQQYAGIASSTTHILNGVCWGFDRFTEADQQDAERSYFDRAFRQAKDVSASQRLGEEKEDERVRRGFRGVIGEELNELTPEKLDELVRKIEGGDGERKRKPAQEIKGRKGKPRPKAGPSSRKHEVPEYKEAPTEEEKEEIRMLPARQHSLAEKHSLMMIEAFRKSGISRLKATASDLQFYLGGETVSEDRRKEVEATIEELERLRHRFETLGNPKTLKSETLGMLNLALETGVAKGQRLLGKIVEDYKKKNAGLLASEKHGRALRRFANKVQAHLKGSLLREAFNQGGEIEVSLKHLSPEDIREYFHGRVYDHGGAVEFIYPKSRLAHNERLGTYVTSGGGTHKNDRLFCITVHLWRTRDDGAAPSRPFTHFDDRVWKDRDVQAGNSFYVLHVKEA